MSYQMSASIHSMWIQVQNSYLSRSLGKFWWVARLFFNLLQNLFELDPQPLFDLVADPKELYFVKDEYDTNTKIAEGVYVYLNNDTNTKIRVLRRAADKYSLNNGDTNDDIVFIMKSSDNDIDIWALYLSQI